MCSFWVSNFRKKKKKIRKKKKKKRRGTEKKIHGKDWKKIVRMKLTTLVTVLVALPLLLASCAQGEKAAVDTCTYRTEEIAGMDARLQCAELKLEIMDWFAAYATSVDAKDWVAFRKLFSPDARFDYSASSSSIKRNANLKEAVEWLRPSLGLFSMTQHMISNFHFAKGWMSACSAEAPTFRVRAMFANPMRFKYIPLQPSFYVAGWYRVEFIRSQDSAGGQRWVGRQLQQEIAYNQAMQFVFISIAVITILLALTCLRRK